MRSKTRIVEVVVVWIEGRGRRSHHVLHVGGSGIDSAPQLVVQLQDLLAVRPADGPAVPAAACCRRRVPCAVHFLPVAPQQLLELRRVRQEEGGGVCDAEEQDGEGREQSRGEGGHPDA